MKTDDAKNADSDLCALNYVVTLACFATHVWRRSEHEARAFIASGAVRLALVCYALLADVACAQEGRAAACGVPTKPLTFVYALESSSLVATLVARQRTTTLLTVMFLFSTLFVFLHGEGTYVALVGIALGVLTMLVSEWQKDVGSDETNAFRIGIVFAHLGLLAFRVVAGGIARVGWSSCRALPLVDIVSQMIVELSFLVDE